MGGELTKTSFVEGWRCPNRLWWYVHEPNAPERAPTESDLLRMEQGQGKAAKTAVDNLANLFRRRGVTPSVIDELEKLVAKEK